MKKFLLFALLLLARTGFSQCYTVTPITYAPDSFNAGTPLYLADDVYSQVIPIPFTFCFYGVACSNLLIGSNSIVSFDTANAGMLCPYYIGTPIPATTSPRNAIFFPWQDIVTNTSLLTYYYNVYGTAPNRRFVVTADSARMYGCPSTEFYTGELMLYETTNIIEVHMRRKDLCATWNNGRAILGLQNSAGTSAAVAAGHNSPAQWTATNEAWRFTPNCCPVGIAAVATENTFSVYPNPASNELHVDYFNAAQKFSVELIDHTGRIVRSEGWAAEPARVIPLQDIAPGMYFVRIVNEQGATLVRKQVVE